MPKPRRPSQRGAAARSAVCRKASKKVSVGIWSKPGAPIRAATTPAASADAEDEPPLKACASWVSPKKLGAQLKYADRRGHRLALIVGDDEWEAGRCQIKDLATGDQHDVALDDVIDACERALSTERS